MGKPCSSVAIRADLKAGSIFVTLAGVESKTRAIQVLC